MKKIFLVLYTLMQFCAFAEHYDNPPLWHNYIENAGNKINENWNPEVFEINASAIIEYKVSKNGELKDIQIIQSTGNKRADDFALNAIIKSAPFEPLPKEYQGDNISIEFKFNYKYTNNSKEEYININKEATQSDELSDSKQYSNAFNAKTSEMKDYIQSVNKKIISNWNPPKIKTYKIFRAILTIRNDGVLVGCKITDTFGMKEADTKAKEAILKSSPFGPFPKEYQGEYISIKYMFDENSTKHSQRQIQKPSDYIDDLDLLFYLSNKKATKD